MKNKKILAVLSMVAVFGMGTLTGTLCTGFTVNANSTVNLDVNGDGAVNVDDVIYLKNEVLGENQQTEKLIEISNFYEQSSDKIVDNTAVIADTYDEYISFMNEYGASVVEEYPDNFFEENSVAIIMDYHYSGVYNYEICSVYTDGQKLSVNLDVHIYDYYKDVIAPVDSSACITFAYKKSDFSGDEIIVNKNEIVDDEPTNDKPVIYLYPEEETNVNVKLDYNGDLTYTYPQYVDGGWNVTAMPDGTLYDENGREYSYLFWEGKSNVDYDFSDGFVVKGEDTVEFLQEKLEYLGLTPREYNEFIVYWLPKMQDNKYNLIKFQTDDYTENAVLDITPKPDSMLRVFMTFKPLDEYIEIPEQELQTFDRKGFAVVEWGGSEIK